MIPHNVTYFADKRTIVYDTFGNVSSDTTNRVSVRQDVLSNVGPIVQGDFKTPNTFRFSKKVWDSMEGREYAYNRLNGRMVLDIIGNSGSLAMGVDSVNSDDVYNQALGQIGDQIRAGIDWSVNLLQARQVASMVRSANEILRKIQRADLAGIYRSYQRFLRANGRDAARTTGGAWLAFVYGIKPLAQDIYNTAVELGRDFPSLMIAEAKVGRQDVSVVNDVYNSVPRTNDIRRSIRCQMKIRYYPNSSTLGLLANFTSLNPASMAWEMLPFSFVADWVYDVGGYMRALETSLLSQSQFRDGFYTISQRSDCHSVVVGSANISGSLTRVCNLGGKCYYSSLNRNRLVSMPFPRAPVFRADLGTGRLLNAAALISQALGRR